MAGPATATPAHPSYGTTPTPQSPSYPEAATGSAARRTTRCGSTLRPPGRSTATTCNSHEESRFRRETLNKPPRPRPDRRVRDGAPSRGVRPCGHRDRLERDRDDGDRHDGGAIAARPDAEF